MQAVVHRDTDYLAGGTHDGADGTLILHKSGADFKSCGVTVGVAVYNDDDGSNGLTTAVTEDTVTCTLSGGTNNTWSNGDQYYIYKTSAYNSKISTLYTDRRFGGKVVKGDPLTPEGLRPEDVDIDEYEGNVFGPGQPEKSHE